MADGTGKRPHSEEDSQLPVPTKLLRKEEWYSPNSSLYGPKKYKPILYSILIQNQLSFSTPFIYRYYLCEYCEYKSLSSTHFKSHVEKNHQITEMKSFSSRSAVYKSASFTKRKKYLTGLKRKAETHVRHRIPVNIKVS